jgi:hypothetical protein
LEYPGNQQDSVRFTILATFPIAAMELRGDKQELSPYE